MIVSLQMLKNSIENYKKTTEPSKERFHLSGKSIKKGSKDAFGLFILIIAVIFFIFELILFYFAIMIAMYCYDNKQERIIQFVLAITLTTPYMLLQTLFNPRVKSFLQNSIMNKKE